MKFFFILLMCLCTVTVNANASDKINLDLLQSIPVQHDGRIKPLSSFARTLLYQYSGHESMNGISATQWMVISLFDPAQAITTPVFRMFKPEILGLPPKEKPYYSLQEIAPEIQERIKLIEKLSSIKPADLNKDQIEILRIKDNAESYIQLLRSFSFILPIHVSLPPSALKEWNIDEKKTFSLFDYTKIEEKVIKKVKSIIKKKGKDPKKYSNDELMITTFSFEMKMLNAGGDGNSLFRIIPGIDSNEWFSPWQTTAKGQASPQTTTYMTLWRDLANAYLSSDSFAWNKTIQDITSISKKFSGTKSIRLEQLYSTLHPLGMALAFYTLAFIGYVLSISHIKGAWYKMAFVALIGGLLFNLVSLVLRVLILNRPPVGTLYESIIFVSVIAAMGCAALEYKKRDGNGLMAGALSGVVLLFTAASFGGGDTLKVLTAVLNTNFWLTTHVLCITAGYGWCLIVSVLAHVWLVQGARGLNNDHLIKPIKIFTLLSLLFTAVGTILGGIWADQSWGRFWGWDPKENGALLIVLWIVWILHGQISGHIKKHFAMAALAALSIIVSIAWFGVNLLNVGLHSYGFISGMAYSLGGFIAFELMLIGVLLYLAKPAKVTS